ncbi:LIM/homeobox protein Awh [Fasciola gigantica]|uniref:LIM/homeobox protein Awh n=1 Tax=Fasciola gigantica TaxID=46835 RepID=A0A504YIK5_FASGI|nr:LIM/homeobox protein Awh [Fasciola gigantica]
MNAIPFCRGCVRPILDRTLLLLLPCWNQNSLSAQLDMNGTETRFNAKSSQLYPRVENQENRRPLRECQDSPTDWRWTLREHSPTNFGTIDCYHAECLSCCECGGRLTATDKRCWKVRDYQVICRPCRIRLTHCGRCRLRVTNDVWVHKLDRLPFHIPCLKCSQCSRQLRQGDRCGLFEDRLLCVEHFLTATSDRNMAGREDVGGRVEQNLLGCNSDEVGRSEDQKELMKHNSVGFRAETKLSENLNIRETELKISQSTHPSFPVVSTEQLGSIIAPESDTTFTANSSQTRTEAPMPVLITVKSDASVGLDAWYGSEPLEHPVVPRESMSAPHGSTECALPVPEAGHSVDSSTSSGCSVHSKSKRIRTSFTPDQLAILQANFDIEANPDGQELERIANVARLNKRVTQVWFQNARARKKKIECKGIGSLTSMPFNPSVYYLQEASNSEDYFDANDEPLLTLVEQNQIMIGDSSGTLLSPYITPMGAFPTTPTVVAVTGATVSVPEGPNEVGVTVPFTGINFSTSNMTESDPLPRKYLGMDTDQPDAVDRVYSILSSMKTMTAQRFPGSAMKEAHMLPAKRPDSINLPTIWSSLSGAQARLMGNPNVNNESFIGKFTTENAPSFGDMEMQDTFSLPSGRCLADEVLSDEPTSARRITTDSIRTMAVFSRV